MPKYEVWVRTAKKSRQRVGKGFSTEAEAQAKREQLLNEGYEDIAVVQRPSKYGQFKGLEKRGRKI